MKKPPPRRLDQPGPGHFGLPILSRLVLHLFNLLGRRHGAQRLQIPPSRPSLELYRHQ